MTWQLSLAGLLIGVLVGTTGIAAVATDMFHAAALLWVAVPGHLVAGNADLGATGWLLLGSVPGVLLGSQVSVKLPDRALRIALATTLTPRKTVGRSAGRVPDSTA